MRQTAMLLVLATALSSVGLATARADVFNNCGHEIRTSYHEGWVIIDSMSGIDGRSDIWVWGLRRTPDGREIIDQQRIQWAIDDRQLWGYNYSMVYIAGHDECTAWLH
jgi:hypothetical protein